MTRTAFRTTCALAGLLALAACNQEPAPPSTQYGSNPQLPAPHQYLVPPMRVPHAVGWAAGTAPVVPAGLQVLPFATGLNHPRLVYALPNGDVLVVESNGPKAPVHRPKDYVMGVYTAYGDTGAASANRITLLRDVNGDGRPDLRTIFLDKLNSPFGVVLVGDQLYVANTDAILRFPYVTGETRITRAGSGRHRPAGRADQPPLDQVPDRQPGRIEALCRRRLQQQHHGEWHGGRGRPRGDLGSGSRHRAQAHLRLGNPQSDRGRLRTANSQLVGGRQRARRDRPKPGARLSDFGAAEAASMAGPTAITDSTWMRACGRNAPTWSPKRSPPIIH